MSLEQWMQCWTQVLNLFVLHKFLVKKASIRDLKRLFAVERVCLFFVDFFLLSGRPPYFHESSIQYICSEVGGGGLVVMKTSGSFARIFIHSCATLITHNLQL